MVERISEEVRALDGRRLQNIRGVEIIRYMGIRVQEMVVRVMHLDIHWDEFTVLNIMSAEF